MSKKFRGVKRISKYQLAAFAQKYMKPGVKAKDGLLDFIYNFFKVAGMEVTISEVFGFDGYELSWSIESGDDSE